MDCGYLRFRKLTFEVKLVLKLEKFSVLVFSYTKETFIHKNNNNQFKCCAGYGIGTYLRGADSPTTYVCYSTNIGETLAKWINSLSCGCFRSYHSCRILDSIVLYRRLEIPIRYLFIMVFLCSYVDAGVSVQTKS